jgi:hypothetical protein
MSRSRAALPFLGLLLVLTACGAEDPPRLSDAGPRPAEINRQNGQQAGAVLAATGRQSYQGPSAFRCVLHEEDGLQINFRTGDPETPTVAVRIGDYRGSGPYRAELFVTGRSRTGALVTSTGAAHVEVQQRELADAGAVVLLSGSFTGAYDGLAGKGSVEGRFDSCGYSAFRNGSPPDSLAAEPSADERGQSAGGEDVGEPELVGRDEGTALSPSSSPLRH